jgi:hypothetical protein
MFDDFRQQADETEFGDQPPQGEAPELAETDSPIRAEARVPIRRKPRRILGMTGPQRFIVAILVMFQVCLLGTMFLLATQRIVPSI